MSRRPKRKGYPSDVSDERWEFARPYLSLLPEKNGQREYGLREVFNGLRYVGCEAAARVAGCPGDLLAWAAVYQQARRRLARSYERLPEVFAGLHFIAFVGLLLSRLASSDVVSSEQALGNGRPSLTTFSSPQQSC